MINAQLRATSQLYVAYMLVAMSRTLAMFTLGVWVYRVTGTASHVAALQLCWVLPGALLAPLAGAIADRYDTRVVLGLSSSARAIVYLLIAAGLLSGHLTVWTAMALAVIFSVLAAPQSSAELVAIWSIFPAKAQIKAASGMYVAQSTAVAVASMLGGILVTRASEWIALASAAILLVISGAAYRWLPITSSEAAPVRPPPMSAPGRCWTSALPSRLASLMIFIAYLQFAAGSVRTLLVPIGLELVGGGGLGRALAAGSAVAIVSGSVAMWASGWVPPITIWVIGSAVIFSSLALIGLPESPLWLLLCYCAMSSAVPWCAAAEQALWGLNAPPDARGQAYGFRQLVARISLPLGSACAGALADLLGAALPASERPATYMGASVAALAIGGVGVVMTSVLWLRVGSWRDGSEQGAGLGNHRSRTVSGTSAVAGPANLRACAHGRDTPRSETERSD